MDSNLRIIRELRNFLGKMTRGCLKYKITELEVSIRPEIFKDFFVILFSFFSGSPGKQHKALLI